MDPIPPDTFLPPTHYLALAETSVAGATTDSGSGVAASTGNVSLSASSSVTEKPVVTERFTIEEAQSTNGLPPASPQFPFRPKSQSSNQPTPTNTNTLTSEDTASKMTNLTRLNSFGTQATAFVNDFNNNPTIEDNDTPSSRRLQIPGCFDITLKENKRITPEDHWQDVRLLTFEMSSDKKYSPGDAITIYPKNFDEDVEHIIKRCGWGRYADVPLKPMWDEDRNIDNMNGEGELCWKKGIYTCSSRPTLRELLTHNLDINAIPRRSQFEFMQTFAGDSDERNRLIELASPLYSEEFFDYATRPRRSILELLDDFPSVKVPWIYVVTFFPLIRGRQYSICTGGVLSSAPGRCSIQKIQLIIALVKYQTVIKKIRQGLCSRYIASLPEGIKIQVTLEPNRDMYPRHVQEITTPLLMIAPGTGIAPIRSLVWDRAQRELELAEDLLDDAAEKARKHDRDPFADSRSSSPDLFESLPPEDTTPGEKLLFFGNRNATKDFFFRQEFCNLAMLRMQVITAFSRDQKEKIYVQDKIREHAELVVDYIEKKNAVVYVCGSSGKMPMGVKDAIADCLALHGETHGLKGNKEHCLTYVEALERMNRWIQETW